MATRSGLRHRILLGLLAYATVLSVAVLMHGFVVNERAEWARPSQEPGFVVRIRHAERLMPGLALRGRAAGLV